MQILLDDQLVPIQGLSIEQALSSAVQRARQDGRMIVEVTVDGVPCTPESLGTLGSRSRAPVAIRMVTVDTTGLLADIGAQAVASLDDLARRQQDAAHHLQAGRATNAMTLLAECITSWQDLEHAGRLAFEAAGSIHTQASGPDSLISNQWLAAVKHLQTQLTIVRNAMKIADYSVLADALLHDMPEVIDAWQTFFHTMTTGSSGAATRRSTKAASQPHARTPSPAAIH